MTLVLQFFGENYPPMFLCSILYNGRLCVQAECCINYEVVAVGFAAFTASLLSRQMDNTWPNLCSFCQCIYFLSCACGVLFCRLACFHC